MEVKLLDFTEFVDKRGHLIPLEANKNIPFKINRIYFIYSINKKMSRGFHAHKKLVQVAICITGYCTIVLDDGQVRKEIDLNSPKKGLVIDNMIWHEMKDFSENCVLMVIADDYYDELDYIRDYGHYLEMLK